MDYSHPNDTKRIELLKEALRWAKLFIEDLEEITILDLSETCKSSLKDRIRYYEQFENDLKQLENNQQLDMFKSND